MKNLIFFFSFVCLFFGSLDAQAQSKGQFMAPESTAQPKSKEQIISIIEAKLPTIISQLAVSEQDAQKNKQAEVALYKGSLGDLNSGKAPKLVYSDRIVEFRRTFTVQTAAQKSEIRRIMNDFNKIFFLN